MERRIEADEHTEMVTKLGGVQILIDKGLDFGESMQISITRLPHLLFGKRWQKFVKSTLNEQQAKKWKQFSDRRANAEQDAHAHALSRAIPLQLDGQQQMAVHGLLRKAVSSPGAVPEYRVEMIPSTEILFEIDKHELITAIGEDKWNQLPDFLRSESAEIRLAIPIPMKNQETSKSNDARLAVSGFCTTLPSRTSLAPRTRVGRCKSL